VTARPPRRAGWNDRGVEAHLGVRRLVKGAMSADEIIGRTTALYKKDTTRRERVDVNA
jgi:hypothetical protein